MQLSIFKGKETKTTRSCGTLFYFKLLTPSFKDLLLKKSSPEWVKTGVNQYEQELGNKVNQYNPKYLIKSEIKL